MRTAALITPDAKLVQDQAWLDDREQLTGRRFSEDAMREYLPDALAAARIHLDLVEGMLDGREWIGGGEEPGLADVHLGWVFDWMLRGPEEMGMRWAYPEVLHEKKYLRVFGWIERLNRVVAEKRKEQGELKVLKDDEAVSMVEQARWFEGEELEMLEWDPTGLKRGNEVDLYATDVLNGWQNRDTGELVGLRADRVSVRTNTKNGVDVRIHYPRINIRITKAESKL